MAHILKTSHPLEISWKKNLPPPLCAHFLSSPSNKRRKGQRGKTKIEKTTSLNMLVHLPRGEGEFTLDLQGVEQSSSIYRNLPKKTLKANKKGNTKANKMDRQAIWRGQELEKRIKTGGGGCEH